MIKKDLEELLSETAYLLSKLEQKKLFQKVFSYLIFLKKKGDVKSIASILNRFEKFITTNRFRFYTEYSKKPMELFKFKQFLKEIEKLNNFGKEAISESKNRS